MNNPLPDANPSELMQKLGGEPSVEQFQRWQNAVGPAGLEGLLAVPVGAGDDAGDQPAFWLQYRQVPAAA